MRKTTVERAFELARSGACESFSDVRRALKQEGYADAVRQLDGAFIRQQLMELIAAAKGAPAPAEKPKALRRKAKARPSIIE